MNHRTGIVTTTVNETHKTIVTKYVIELTCRIVTDKGNETRESMVTWLAIDSGPWIVAIGMRETHDEMVTCSSDWFMYLDSNNENERNTHL